MNIMIRGDKLKITPAIKAYIEAKIGRLNKYFEDNSDLKATVNAKVKNASQIIEVTIPIKKFTLRAEETNHDLYAAIDLVVDKLESQIRKNKTRLQEKFKKQNVLEFSYDIKQEDIDNYNIIKRKEIELKPMDEEEAILQLELIDHDFFVFRNLNEDCISIIYKRKDNNYGIINTK